MIEIKIENIVASTILAEKLDLNMIAKLQGEIKYDHEKFPGLFYRSNKPNAVVLVFKNGKANITGVKNIEDIYSVVNRIVKKLRMIKVDVFKNKDIKIDIQNMVATSDLETDIDLNEVAICLGLEKVEYEPEQFPALIYRLEESKIVILLFANGKIVCAGARTIKELLESVDKFSDKLIFLGFIN